MKLFDSVTAPCALIGMIHLKALPGTPKSSLGMDGILEHALRDLDALVSGGVDAIIVENMADLPYCRSTVGPEITAAMAVVVEKIVQKSGLPVGVQVLAAANLEAMAVATCAGAQFIRAEAFAYAHVADEGIINASAAEVLRYRRNINSNVKIWADVQKKHASHAITADLSLSDLAHGFHFCGANALIATGVATGAATRVQDIVELKSAKLPVVVGSGIDAKNILDYASIADGLIVGSSIKIDGNWENPVDLNRVKTLRRILDELALNETN